MEKRDSRAEYEARMHRVLEHIDRHLDARLDLATLARVAHFSPFHFHRLFSAWMGETLGDYLRRRRVEIAAQRLAAQPRLPILQVALSVGFGSNEAFARAFRARFGRSASAWRAQAARNRKAGQDNRNSGQAHAGKTVKHGPPRKEVSMNVRLVDRKPVEVAYLRHNGPYGEAVAVFWKEKVYPWMAQNNLLGASRFGVGHDDPSVTEHDKCRYDACVEVPPGFAVHGGAQRTILPGGRYAVLPFRGTAAEVGAAWDALLRDWLPSSGLQLGSLPCIEHYPPKSNYDSTSGRFECELCIPVVPL